VKTPISRRAPTFEQRLSPCECCGYPLSQRHHAIPFVDHGETNLTIQVCATCHELYHVVWAAVVDRRPKALALVGHFRLVDREAERFAWVHDRVKQFHGYLEWAASFPQRLEADAASIRERLARGESIEQVAASYDYAGYHDVYCLQPDYLSRWLDSR
jgi:hypothetical protein